MYFPVTHICITFSDGTNTATFDPLNLIPDNSYYGAGGKTMTRAATSQWGFQNSEPASVFPGFNMNAAGTYAVSLSATRDSLVSSVGITVNAQETPEPATLGLMGSALLGLCLVGSRRFNRSK